MSEAPRINFIRRQIEDDLANRRHAQIVTRFPPEPNGYLHIGHAKSIWLNFGIAADCGGRCILRFDDTNPANEDEKFSDAIRRDVEWLGYHCDSVTYASDYFDKLYGYAVELIRKQLAYVDSDSASEIRAKRGTLTEPGVASAHRSRSVEENLALFAAMKNGAHAEGEMVLRARIDMASPNINLRDPVLYRILHRQHQRSGDAWCIYPLYDFAHGQSDAIEGVTHSLCTLEFEDHRALYDWFIDHLELPSRPRQIEFSRLNLTHTVMSKRALAQLVDNGDVDGWDDPRMPTLSGLRRRGAPPAALRRFIELVGITRKENLIDATLLENCMRDELGPSAQRAMAVLDPLKLVIINYPPDQTETLEAPNHPGDEQRGVRQLSLSRELYIERDDYRDDPPKKFFRLAPGREVRLRYAFVVRCVDVVRDADGRAREVHCKYLDDTRHGAQPEGRKVKGIIHWVNARDCCRAEVRLYDRLFTDENPAADKTRDFRQALNPNSLQIRDAAMLESSLGEANADAPCQFERLGYFCRDANAKSLTFNRIVTLRDSWAKIDRRPPKPRDA